MGLLAELKGDGNVLLWFYVLLSTSISPQNCYSIKEWHFYMVRSGRIRKFWPHGPAFGPSHLVNLSLSFPQYPCRNVTFPSTYLLIINIFITIKDSIGKNIVYSWSCSGNIMRSWILTSACRRKDSKLWQKITSFRRNLTKMCPNQYLVCNFYNMICIYDPLHFHKFNNSSKQQLPANITFAIREWIAIFIHLDTWIIHTVIWNVPGPFQNSLLHQGRKLTKLD